ncbi:MAG: KTSC domain-containing protein [Anaerolineae bacterium]|nr:KTSC domain-containing protein [Anaerolineae bacterium]
MEHHDVESTVIDAVGYSRVLEIKFESGRIYQYYDVPERIYNEMLKATSKGKYFNSHIRGKFNYREIQLPDK